MTLLVGVYCIVLWIANVGLCAWLAGEKNRSQGFWIPAAIFLGLLATLFLIGAPVSEAKE